MSSIVYGNVVPSFYLKSKKNFNNIVNFKFARFFLTT